MFRSLPQLPALAAISIVVAAPALARDIRTERVNFAHGASSATVEGSIKGYETVDYALGAKKGQSMNVNNLGKRLRMLGAAGLLALAGAASAEDASLSALAESSAAVAPAAHALALAAAEPDPVIAAIAVVGGALGSKRVRLESKREGTEGPGPVTVVVAREGFLDDSVWGDWHRVELSPAPESRGWQVTSVHRAIRCQPGRGAERWRDQICR